MTPPSKSEAPTNGDSISIQDIKIGGALIRKTAMALMALGAGSGGYSLIRMHNSEIESLKTRMEIVEKNQTMQNAQFLLYVQLTNPKVFRMIKENFQQR